MAKRRGPSDGYDFGSKRQYRRNIYAAFRRFFRGHVADRTVLMMPSIEGDEIEVAMRAGFRQQNIIAVDKNKAIVATLKRRYPLIKTYGVEVGEAATRAYQDGVRVDAINFDLCGPIGDTMSRAVGPWMSTQAVINANAVVAVTCLRGRERGVGRDSLDMLDGPQYRTAFQSAAQYIPEFIRGLDPRDLFRVWTVGSVLGLSRHRLQAVSVPQMLRGVSFLTGGIYRSTAGNQSMLWTVYSIHGVGCQCEQCVAQGILLEHAQDWKRSA
jgi:hypothetical protein